MSLIRKSPSDSATLYKIGTKKKGNDGNIWIIVENKNNVKKWQKVSEKEIKVEKKESPKILTALDFYDIAKIKKNNWKKWCENLTLHQTNFINKVRNSYKSIEKETGIFVIEVILPISQSGMYFIDYTWDYAKELYPTIHEDDKPYMIVIYKLTKDLHLYLDITVQHKGILGIYKKKLLEYKDKFNKEVNGKMIWNGDQKKIIFFNL